MVAALLIVSVVGVYDHLEYSGALWTGVSHLLDNGVPASDINGGYVVNGWLQYAHPENAIRDNKGVLVVAWINANDVGQGHQLSNAPMPGWTTIETIPYKRWLTGSGAVYAIQRSDGPR